MAKGNDKKVVRQACGLLLGTIGNLLESHREKTFTYAQRPKPLPRRIFCNRTHLDPNTVTYIETGRFLFLKFSKLREYLATTYKRNDAEFTDSVKKVFDGLKELDDLLREL